MDMALHQLFWTSWTDESGNWVTISTLVFSIPHFKDDNPSYIPLLSYLYKIYSEQDKRQAEVRTS